MATGDVIDSVPMHSLEKQDESVVDGNVSKPRSLLSFRKGKPNKTDVKDTTLTKLTEADINIHDGSSLVPTDAVGKIRLLKEDSYDQSPSEYVRLDKDTDINNVVEFIKKDWDLQRPSFLMSVTGGAKDYNPNSTHEKECFNGIVEAAVSSNAWIITGGTNVGVMKCIGQAVRNQRQVNGADTVAIGIATWGVVNKGLQQKMTRTGEEIEKVKKLLENNSRWYASPLEKSGALSGYLPVVQMGELDTDDGVDLERNHTHFVLVDSRDTEFGGEIELRGRLEGAISKNWETDNSDPKQNEPATKCQQIPVELGNNDNEDAYGTQIPVVCIAIEGGPGTIQTAYEAVKNGTPLVVVDNTGRAADLMARVFKEELKDKSKVTKDDKRLSENSEFQTLAKDKMEKAIKEINVCLDHPHLLNVFERQSGKEIKETIFNAVKKAQTNPNEQLKLALNWDRVDMFDEKNLTTMTCQDENGRSDALRFALIHNRPEFTKIILEKVDIKSYLTEEELVHLYNAQPPSSLLRILLKETTKKNLNDKMYDIENVNDLIRKLTGNAFDMKHDELSKTEYGCMQLLLIYAVLNNFEEMADHLWEKGRDAIPTALAASKLYKCMASLRFQDTKLETSMLDNARKYEDWACGILTQCQKNPGKCKPADLLLRVVPNWGGVTCLNLAESAENITFLSHPVVTGMLENMWQGKLKGHDLIPTDYVSGTMAPIVLLLCSVLPFLIPFLVQFRENLTWWKKILYYYIAPRSVFSHNVVSYIVFVVLFSYNLLWEPMPISIESASWSDWLLFVWMLSMITEECRQMLEWEANSFILRARYWWAEHWNKLDVLAMILFVAGNIVRFNATSNTVEQARIILALDLFIYYFRFLEYLTFVKTIGPKVLMIGKMVIDLLFFMCIVFIILIGYGIAFHVILYPHVKDPSTVLESIVYRPYFQIYGELFLEELRATPDDGSCTFNVADIQDGGNPCAEHSSIGVFLLATYLLFSNVLLLNLLIAMFSNTFRAVQELTDLHWRFQRYKLTKEYVSKPIFVPPLSIISHIGHVLLFILTVLCCCTEFYVDFIRYFNHLRRDQGEIDKNHEERLLLWEEAKANQYTKQIKKGKMD